MGNQPWSQFQNEIWERSIGLNCITAHTLDLNYVTGHILDRISLTTHIKDLFYVSAYKFSLNYITAYICALIFCSILMSSLFPPVTIFRTPVHLMPTSTSLTEPLILSHVSVFMISMFHDIVFLMFMISLRTSV